MSKLGKTLAQIEELLDSGAVSEARNRVSVAAKSQRIPRESRLKLACFARRAHMPGKAVMLLHRTVRPGNSQRDGGTPAERSEYAASLTAIGAPKEAIALLEGLNPSELPLVWYFRAMTAVYQWDWDASIPSLEHYARSPGLTGDLRHWAKIFLANSLTRGPGEFSRADSLLREVIEKTNRERYRMAYKNALLGLLQNETLRGSAKSAALLYERIEKEDLGDEDPLFTLVVEQWKATADLLCASAGHKAEPANRLKRIIQAYVADRRWENARGAELHLAIGLRDRESLLSLGYGTPYPSFRERAFAEARKLDPSAELPRFCDRSLNEGNEKTEGIGKSDTPVIDSADGRTTLNPKTYLKPGFLLQTLFSALASDFYKPLLITELHERLYPGEKFFPASSPERIHQLVLRLRLWFEAHRLPIEIEERYGAYTLTARSPLKVRVWEPGLANDKSLVRLDPDEQESLDRLRAQFKTRAFSATEASLELGSPLRSTIRRLTEAVASGVISRIGQARATRYRFP